MSKLRIIVKIPAGRRKDFSVSFGNKSRLRKDSSIVYKWTEVKLRRLSKSLASLLPHKTVLLVDYGNRHLNEAEGQDAKQLLYALACFLEDYLPKSTLESKCKKYREIKETKKRR